MTEKQAVTLAHSAPIEHPSLAAAMAAFQAGLPAVLKGATGQVPGKKEYKYADLADLSQAVLPLLGKHGLSWLTMPTVDEHGRFVLQYELLHTSGEKRTGVYPLPQDADAWKIGSALSYGRRYLLSAVTGVAADEDDDGAAAQGERHTYARPPARPAEQRPQPERPAARAGEGDPAQARATLAVTCNNNNWPLDVVERLFLAEHGVALGACTDALKIAKFRTALLASPPAELGEGAAA